MRSIDPGMPLLDVRRMAQQMAKARFLTPAEAGARAGLMAAAGLEKTARHAFVQDEFFVIYERSDSTGEGLG